MIAGRYTLEREIGRGGMGSVWLGQDEALGRPVAMKRIGMIPGADGPDLARVEREAKLAARLNHPHVVAVYDLVDEGDHQWLVMEYVEGVNLSALVRRDGPLSVDTAAALIGQAARALSQAHAAGIVHRDVKPSNLLVTESGQVKLTDFGIARASADAALTQTGLVTGSPAYLAPEVATGKSASTASDVWSLGATLFHALEGRPPYDAGNDVLGAMYRIVHENPPRPTDAGWLAPLLAATMVKEVDLRWSMHEVEQFLLRGPQAGCIADVAPPAVVGSTDGVLPDTAIVEQPVPAFVPRSAEPPAAGQRRRRTSSWVPAVAVAAVVALVAAVTALVLQLNQDDTSPTSATPETSSSPSEPATPSETQTPTATPTEADDAEVSKAMTEFVDNYLSTVVTDRVAAWQQLTPQFQQDSGGFEKYDAFWKRYNEATIIDIGATPDRLIVQYSVEYGAKRGEGFSDTVTLRLEEFGDSFLIAGEV